MGWLMEGVNESDLPVRPRVIKASQEEPPPAEETEPSSASAATTTKKAKAKEKSGSTARSRSTSRLDESSPDPTDDAPDPLSLRQTG